jgi:hypothetical protein
VEAVVLTVSVDEFAVVGFGLNEAVAPAGSPDRLKVTLPVKPPLRVIVTVNVVLAPWVMVLDDGDADRVKLAGELTTSVTVVECTMVPLVPVMLNG